MPQINPITITIGSQDTVYIPADTQKGDIPSKFITSVPTLQLDQANILTHVLTAGPSNMNAHIKQVDKFLATVDEQTVVSLINSWEFRFSASKGSTLAQRTHTIDSAIATLTAMKTTMANAERYW